MKSIILFICILICINTNAQQKNAKGEKIVTSVEVENYSQKGNLYEKSTIIYKYYDYNKLISINKHTIMAIGEDIRKTKETLINYKNVVAHYIIWKLHIAM